MRCIRTCILLLLLLMCPKGKAEEHIMLFKIILSLNHDPNKMQSIFVLCIKFKILVVCVVKSTVSQINYIRHRLQFSCNHCVKNSKSCRMMVLWKKNATHAVVCPRHCKTMLLAYKTLLAFNFILTILNALKCCNALSDCLMNQEKRNCTMFVMLRKLWDPVFRRQFQQV